MRIALCGLAVAAIVSSTLAVHSVAQTPAAAMKSFASAADVAALMAKAKSERKEGQAMVLLPIVGRSPYSLNLEYRVAVATASIHEREAELFYVVDGAGTMVVGGRLRDEKRTNAENLGGSGIEGGESRHIAKGDVIMVPENTAHWFSGIEGSLTLMSLHLPAAAQRASSR